MEIRVILAASPAEVEDALGVRRRVFVEEQGIAPRLEQDGHDVHAQHAVAYAGTQPVGAGRLVREGGAGRIGRMAVLAPFRRRGIGGRILDLLLAAAREQGLQEVYLHAQATACDFYRKRGFEPQGRVFEEAGLPHLAMGRRL